MTQARSPVVTKLSRTGVKTPRQAWARYKRFLNCLHSKIWDERVIGKNLLKVARGHVQKNSLIVIDLSEIAKRHAKKMEKLAKVRDASEKKIVSGYWMFCGYVINGKGNPIPIQVFVFCYDDEDEYYRSENDVIIQALLRMKEAFGDKGIYVFDRGFDRQILLEFLLDNDFRFVVRAQDKRTIRFLRGNSHSTRKAARIIMKAQTSSEWMTPPDRAGTCKLKRGIATCSCRV